MRSSKAGRPRIEFDLSAIEGLGRIGATIDDMVHVLPASKRTIADRMAEPESDFRIAYEKGRSLLNSSLRRKQIQVAMTGNVTMLIWLGKQHLGQQDRIIQDTVDYGPLLKKWAEAKDWEALQRVADGEHPDVILRERAGVAHGGK